MKRQHYNEVNRFANPAHEALMGVWWSGLMLKRTARAFFRAHAVSDTQFNALVVLKVTGRPLTQRELGERLLVDKSDLTGVIDRMEKAGLVARRAVKGDRRCNAVALVTRVMSAFTPAETATLTKLMVRLHDALDAAAGDYGNMGL